MPPVVVMELVTEPDVALLPVLMMLRPRSEESERSGKPLATPTPEVKEEAREERDWIPRLGEREKSLLERGVW